MPWLDPEIPHFEDGGRFPEEYAERSPPITWSDPGTNVESYAIFLEDVSAAPPRIHWCVFDLPEKLRGIPADVGGAAEVAGGKQATNDFGECGYTGPAFAEGTGHRFRVSIYGVTKKLGLPAGVSASAVRAAVSGNVSQVATRAAVSLVAVERSAAQRPLALASSGTAFARREERRAS